MPLCNHLLPSSLGEAHLRSTYKLAAESRVAYNLSLNSLEFSSAYKPKKLMYRTRQRKVDVPDAAVEVEAEAEFAKLG